MDRKHVFRIAFGGVFMALIFVMTLVKIPNLGWPGYLNLGDSFIFVCSFFLGPVIGGIAGGIGSAFADLVNGFALYAPFTLLIKGAEGIIAGLLLRTQVLNKRNAHANVMMVVYLIFSVLIMPVGYFITDKILAGTAGATGALVGNFFQAAASVVIGYIVINGMKRSKALQGLSGRK